MLCFLHEAGQVVAKHRLNMIDLSDIFGSQLRKKVAGQLITLLRNRT